jgi:hypothetical protein
MALTLVANTNTILASDINQIQNVLQRQVGQTEVGDYWLSAGVYVNGGSFGYFVSSLSRTSVPTGVVLGTALHAAANCNAPATDHLTANGFHVFSSSTAINTGCQVAGLYTTSF